MAGTEDTTRRVHVGLAGDFFMRAVMDGAPDAMIVVSREGRIAFTNAQIERLFGYTPDELVGQLIEILVPERFRARHSEQRQGYFDDPHPRPMGAGMELYGRRKDGTEFPIEISLAPLPTEEGLLVSSSIRDVSDRQQAEEARLRATEAADAASRELEAFTYSVAHDLRAPLRSLDGFSQALLEDYADKLDAEGKTYLAHIRESAQEMAQQIDGLLKLSRVTRGELRHELVDLSALAQTTTARLRKWQPDRHVDVMIGERLISDGDPRLLCVLLDNLIGNAWKFTARRSQARVEFDLLNKDGPATYFVRDNGAGFDMRYAGKLFGVFQRLHATTEFDGTGIGLATVQRIVRRHGGRVWAEGVVDEGATFYFTLGEKGQRR